MLRRIQHWEYSSVTQCSADGHTSLCVCACVSDLAGFWFGCAVIAAVESEGFSGALLGLLLAGVGLRESMWAIMTVTSI